MDANGWAAADRWVGHLSSVTAAREGGGDDKRFARALEALDRLASDCSMPLAIVGGLAAIRHGYAATTEDIDIVVGRENLDRLIRSPPTLAFGWCGGRTPVGTRWSSGTSKSPSCRKEGVQGVMFPRRFRDRTDRGLLRDSATRNCPVGWN